MGGCRWRILSQLGFALNLNGDSDEAVACCTRAVEIAPWNPDAHTNLGLVLLAQRDFPRAMGCFEKAIALGGETAPRLVNLGLALAARGMRPKAVTCYAGALELDAADFRANRELGQVRLEAKDFAAALRHFERAGQLPPTPDHQTSDVGGLSPRQGGALRLGDLADFPRRALQRFVRHSILQRLLLGDQPVGFVLGRVK